MVPKRIGGTPLSATAMLMVALCTSKPRYLVVTSFIGTGLLHVAPRGLAPNQRPRDPRYCTRSRSFHADYLNWPPEVAGGLLELLKVQLTRADLGVNFS